MTEHKRAIVPAPEHAVTPYEGDRPAGVDAPEAPTGQVPAPPRKRVLLYVGLPVVALLAYGAYGHWSSGHRAAATQQQFREFVPSVRTAQAARVDKPVTLTQPGQTLAFDAANIYARSTGYVAERRVDIGSRVRKGDLMIRISAPDLDQQLEQAQAQEGQTQAALLQAQAGLQQAEANRGLANVTKYRATTLASQGWETKQNADNSTATAAVDTAGVTSSQAGIAVAQANLRAQQATVHRLQELAAFERVTAPFDGVVTARTVDVGDLVTSDNASGTSMLSIARDDVLRVAVYVPQSAAVGIRDGETAKVTVPELPGHVFDGHVSRSAGALDPGSRTLLTEVDVINTDGLLKAGLFVDVNFEIPRQAPGVVVPDEALLFGAKGMQVAIVQDGKAHFQNVSLYRDFGTSAELRQGLKGGETLILQPPADLADGAKVKVQDEQKGDAS